MILFAKTMKT